MQHIWVCFRKNTFQSNQVWLVGFDTTLHFSFKESLKGCVKSNWIFCVRIDTNMSISQSCILMSHWGHMMVNGAEFWIICKQLKLLRKAGRLQCDFYHRGKFYYLIGYYQSLIFYLGILYLLGKNYQLYWKSLRGSRVSLILISPSWRVSASFVLLLPERRDYNILSRHITRKTDKLLVNNRE